MRRGISRGAFGRNKGYMLWEGTVENGRLQASLVWHRPDRDEPIRYQISGTEK